MPAACPAGPSQSDANLSPYPCTGGPAPTPRSLVPSPLLAALSLRSPALHPQPACHIQAVALVLLGGTRRQLCFQRSVLHPAHCIQVPPTSDVSWVVVTGVGNDVRARGGLVRQAVIPSTHPASSPQLRISLQEERIMCVYMIKNFDVRNCEATVPDDKRLVEGLIEEMHGSLDEFNEKARSIAERCVLFGAGGAPSPDRGGD